MPRRWTSALSRDTSVCSLNTEEMRLLVACAQGGALTEHTVVASHTFAPQVLRLMCGAVRTVQLTRLIGLPLLVGLQFPGASLDQLLRSCMLCCQSCTAPGGCCAAHHTAGWSCQTQLAYTLLGYLEAHVCKSSLCGGPLQASKLRQAMSVSSASANLCGDQMSLTLARGLRCVAKLYGSRLSACYSVASLIEQSCKGARTRAAQSLHVQRTSYATHNPTRLVTEAHRDGSALDRSQPKLS